MKLPAYPNMRSTTSGFPDSIPDHWYQPRINYRFTVTLGKMLDAARVTQAEAVPLPYIRAGNIQDSGLDLAVVNEMPFTPTEQRSLNLLAGDLLVVEGGAVGTNYHLTQAMPSWSFQKTVNRIRSRRTDSTRFLGYCITACRDVGIIDMICNKSTIAHLTAEKLQELRVPMPSAADQNLIADFLDRETAQTDELIAKQKALIELLAERRKAVITQAVTRGRQSVGTGEFDGGALGVIPAHWARSLLKYVIARQESGTSVNATDVPAQAGEIGVLKTSSVSTGVFDPTKNKLVLDEDLGRVTCPVMPGTLIVNRANTPALVGATGLVREPAPGLYLSDKLWQLSFTAASASFIYYWTQTELYRTQLSSIRVGTSSSMQNIPYDGFRNLAISVPPLVEQESIVEYLDVETARIAELADPANNVVALLRERRSALITAAVTGKIDVRGAA